MKSFNIHHLALFMVTMTGMMFAATLNPTKTKLRQIEQEAKAVLLHVPPNTTVIKIPSQHICDKFFCYAATVLKLTPKDRWHDYYAKLSEALQNYNKEQKSTECDLNVNHTGTIKDFVDRLITCVDFELMKPGAKV